MNRTTMRSRLRRRLNEDSPDNWTDDDLNELLGQGLIRLQTLIMRTEPQAFLTSCITDLVQGQSYYLKPGGMIYEVRVETKAAGVGATYAAIKRGDFDDVANDALAQSGGQSTPQTRYAHFGKELFIGPAPSENVSGGLKVFFVPTLSMAVDTDVPQVVLPLHMGIVLYAHLFAIGETGEGRDQIREDLKEILADIPSYYRKTGAEPETIQPQVDKGY